MILEWSALTAAFLLGLFSSAHCVGMCGGIMGALSMAIPANAKARRWVILLSYNLGRIFSYALMGALVGIFAQQITASGGAVWLRWLAGLLLIAMGLYLANWWRGLTYLEAGGRYLWAYLQPLGKSLMPVDNAAKALLLGGLWGWLPCGLVYSALAYAMAQGDAIGGGLVMLAFGLGTLPTVMATGFIAQQLGRLLQRRQIRWSLALLVILFGLWTIWGGGHTGHAHHTGSDEHSHQHEQEHQHNHQHRSDSSSASPVAHEHAGHTEVDHSTMDHSAIDHSSMEHSPRESESAGDQQPNSAVSSSTDQH